MQQGRYIGQNQDAEDDANATHIALPIISTGSKWSRLAWMLLPGSSRLAGVQLHPTAGPISRASPRQCKQTMRSRGKDFAIAERALHSLRGTAVVFKTRRTLRCLPHVLHCGVPLILSHLIYLLRLALLERRGAVRLRTRTSSSHFVASIGRVNIEISHPMQRKSPRRPQCRTFLHLCSHARASVTLSTSATGDDHAANAVR